MNHLFLLTERNSKRISALQELQQQKRQRVKLMISVCFAENPSRGNPHPKQRVRLHQAPSLEHLGMRALCCVSEHLGLISMYFAHPRASCVLR